MSESKGPVNTAGPFNVYEFYNKGIIQFITRIFDLGYGDSIDLFPKNYLVI